VESLSLRFRAVLSGLKFGEEVEFFVIRSVSARVIQKRIILVGSKIADKLSDHEPPEPYSISSGAQQFLNETSIPAKNAAGLADIFTHTTLRNGSITLNFGMTLATV
jgi:hypothetical protein